MKEHETVVQLSMPADAQFIDVARLTLYGLAAKMGFSYEEIEDMKVAVSEACNNAVLHAYNGRGGVIHLRFEMRADALSIIIKDEGKGFDYKRAAKQAAPLSAKPLEDVKAGGLGLFLMEALMDDVTVTTKGGTEVRLTKFRHRGEGEHAHDSISPSSVQEQA
ncbi:anti-sigma B factor RsbW [Geobacillus proteiniphilus]|uniref:Anti-sigma B factor RsbW n=1 Tax=Geobacillus proteiniphilus TaxID=860353 RepID=A0A1Q5T954_9BACL|nr:MULTISPECIES: anti-sigma B factor RsbW [Geobacillus]OKO96753.1 Serine-protein kinase RsbW [Geobacillus proteiniphilus]OPX02402.1 anti-sigma B factor RsbW [Geobacillus sp. LEMMY01]WMJ16239.1 anti-sigma B factor RsbW [Geobacillus proteiniphilus]